MDASNSGLAELVCIEPQRKSIRITAKKGLRYNSDYQKTAQLRYFCGVVRRLAGEPE